jgi:hypothetical protein
MWYIILLCRVEGTGDNFMAQYNFGTTALNQISNLSYKRSSIHSARIVNIDFTELLYDFKLYEEKGKLLLP